MKEIKLTQGKVALVDDEDFDYLNQWRWHAVLVKGNYYASRNYRLNKNKRIALRMHWVIVGKKDNCVIDHRDHNGLNNQKHNLRICSQHQNIMNQTKRHGRSKYLGVGFVENTIRARICINRKPIHIGCFKTEEDAAWAYDKKAKELFGEFANLNFK